MRKAILTSASVLALAFAGPALAGGAPGGSVNYGSESFAGNQGSIGSGAYGAAKNGGYAISGGMSSVDGASYSSTCSSCDAYTTVDFDSVSKAGTLTHGNAEGEAYGQNNVDWKTTVSKYMDVEYSWHGNFGYYYGW